MGLFSIFCVWASYGPAPATTLMWLTPSSASPPACPAGQRVRLRRFRQRHRSRRWLHSGGVTFGRSIVITTVTSPTMQISASVGASPSRSCMLSHPDACSAQRLDGPVHRRAACWLSRGSVRWMDDARHQHSGDRPRRRPSTTPPNTARQPISAHQRQGSSRRVLRESQSDSKNSVVPSSSTSASSAIFRIDLGLRLRDTHGVEIDEGSLRPARFQIHADAHANLGQRSARRRPVGLPQLVISRLTTHPSSSSRSITGSTRSTIVDQAFFRYAVQAQVHQR